MDPNLDAVVADILLAGVEPQVVLGHVAEFWRFHQWLQAIGGAVESVSELRVAGYLHNCLGRGKSVPGRVRSALIWLQRVASIELGAEKTEFRSMIRSASQPATGQCNPEAARMIPIEVVRKLEHGAKGASTTILKIFCGLACLLTHGAKRWSDAQRLKELFITEDAVVVCSWKSKKKKRQIKWSAMRQGFEKVDWAENFLEALKLCDLLGEDYLLLAARNDFMGFTKTPARWGDAERGIHAALIDVGLDVDEAISYSMHSFKHLYPTAARQLGMDEPLIDVMCGWAVKSSSGMPAVYDSVAASAELVHKSYVCKNVQAGWRIADEGCLPEQPKVEGSSSGSRPSGAQESPSKKRSGAELQERAVKKFPLDDTVCQVLNAPAGRVHLVLVGGKRTMVVLKRTAARTLCGHWVCGTKQVPVQAATFANSSSRWSGSNSVYSFCESCYGDCYPMDRLEVKDFVPDDDVPEESDSSSSSSSDSS